MFNYLYALLADVFFSGGFVFQKKYQQKKGVSIGAGLVFNILTSGMLSVIFLVICGFAPDFSAYSLVFAFLQAMICSTYTLISFYIMKEGSLSMYSLFLMTGGMIVPYVWGVLFLGEGCSLFHITGLILITLSICFTAFEKKKIKYRVFFLCLIVFFVNGMSSVLAKIHQIEKVYTIIRETDFLFWSNLCSFCMSFAMYFFVSHFKPEFTKTNGISYVLLCAIASGLATYFNLKGASCLPATVLYPLVTGGTIVLSFVFESIVFKEKITFKKLLPVTVCFAGICMFV